jgi:hypothetical protein
MRVPNLWPFSSRFLIQWRTVRRAASSQPPEECSRCRRLALASPGAYTTGSGSIAFLVRRARGHCRSALTIEHGAPRGSPSWATTTEVPGGRQRPELDQAPAGVPRSGVVTDLPVAHRHDRDATELGRRWHLARAADAGGERRVLATTLALGIAAAAHSCEIVEGTEVSKWW